MAGFRRCQSASLASSLTWLGILTCNPEHTLPCTTTSGSFPSGSDESGLGSFLRSAGGSKAVATGSFGVGLAAGSLCFSSRGSGLAFGSFCYFSGGSGLVLGSLLGTAAVGFIFLALGGLAAKDKDELVVVSLELLLVLSARFLAFFSAFLCFLLFSFRSRLSFFHRII